MIVLLSRCRPLYFLIGVRSRLTVALNWLWIYTLNQRSARLITHGAPPPFARQGASVNDIAP